MAYLSIYQESLWKSTPHLIQLIQKAGIVRPFSPLHVANFIDCMKTRNKTNCDIETGAHIARFSHMGNIAYRLGRKLNWDGEKQEFINDAEANAMTKATYCAPWSLPKV